MEAVAAGSPAVGTGENVRSSVWPRTSSRSSRVDVVLVSPDRDNLGHRHHTHRGIDIGVRHEDPLRPRYVIDLDRFYGVA